MLTTRGILVALGLANPDADVTEDRLRSLIRRGVIPTPQIVAGRYIWRPEEVVEAAEALGLRAPSRKELEAEGAS